MAPVCRPPYLSDRPDDRNAFVRLCGVHTRDNATGPSGRRARSDSCCCWARAVDQRGADGEAVRETGRRRVGRATRRSGVTGTIVFDVGG